MENTQNDDLSTRTQANDQASLASSQSGVTVGNGGVPKSRSKGVMIGLLMLVLLVLAGGAFALLRKEDNKKAITGNNTQLQKIKVGLLLPYSGGAIGAGFGETKGAQLAKKQLGADSIEFVKADSKCDADAATKAMNELVAKKVVAVIGEACSAASVAALKVADAHKIPMVSPSASSPALSKADDYFFRVVPPDEFQGKFTAKLMHDRAIKKVSVLYVDETYGQALSSVFKKSFEALGGQIVSTGTFGTNDTSVTTQANAVKAAKPDAIYLIANSTPPAVASMKQIRALGVTVPFYGSDGVNDKIILNEAGKAAEGLYVTAFSSGTKTFKQALANAYPSDELLFAAAESYDAFNAIYLAAQTGATTGPQIKEALMNVDFQGVSGHIKFNQNGEVTEAEHHYDVLQAKDGSFVAVE